jgi:hypothetical protein
VEHKVLHTFNAQMPAGSEQFERIELRRYPKAGLRFYGIEVSDGKEKARIIPEPNKLWGETETQGTVNEYNRRQQGQLYEGMAAEHHEAMQRQQEAHQQAMEQQATAHQEAMAQREAEHQQLLEQRATEHAQELAHQAETHQQALEQLQTEHAQAMTQQAEQHTQAIEALEARIEQLETQLQNQDPQQNHGRVRGFFARIGNAFRNGFRRGRGGNQDPVEPAPDALLAQTEFDNEYLMARQDLAVITDRRRARIFDRILPWRRAERRNYQEQLDGFSEHLGRVLEQRRLAGEQLEMTPEQIEAAQRAFVRNEQIELANMGRQWSDNQVNDLIENGNFWQRFTARNSRRWANLGTGWKIAASFGVAAGIGVVAGTAGLGMLGILIGGGIKTSFAYLGRRANVRNVTERRLQSEIRRIHNAHDENDDPLADGANAHGGLTRFFRGREVDETDHSRGWNTLGKAGIVVGGLAVAYNVLTLFQDTTHVPGTASIRGILDPLKHHHNGSGSGSSGTGAEAGGGGNGTETGTGGGGNGGEATGEGHGGNTGNGTEGGNGNGGSANGTGSGTEAGTGNGTGSGTGSVMPGETTYNGGTVPSEGWSAHGGETWIQGQPNAQGVYPDGTHVEFWPDHQGGTYNDVAARLLYGQHFVDHGVGDVDWVDGNGSILAEHVQLTETGAIGRPFIDEATARMQALGHVMHQGPNSHLWYNDTTGPGPRGIVEHTITTIEGDEELKNVAA